QSPGVRGELAVGRGLATLLEGTGLEFTVVNERTVAIRAASRTSAAQARSDGLWVADASTTSPDSGSAESQRQEGSPGQAAENADGVTLDEVVVTANKRSETFQNVPATLQVLTSKALETEGIVQLSDYAKKIPGLTMNGGGGPGQGEIVIRG